MKKEVMGEKELIILTLMSGPRREDLRDSLGSKHDQPIYIEIRINIREDEIDLCLKHLGLQATTSWGSIVNIQALVNGLEWTDLRRESCTFTGILKENNIPFEATMDGNIRQGKIKFFITPKAST